MIKATGHMKDGRTLLVLGVSDGNLERLKAGDSIYIDLASMHVLPGEPLGVIAIFYGKDDAALTHAILPLMGPQSEFIAVPRGDDRPV